MFDMTPVVTRERRYPYVIAMILFLGLALSLHSETYERLIYSKIRLLDTSTATLQELDLGRDQLRWQDGKLEAILDERELFRLDEKGVDYEILIPDLIQHYHEEVRIPDAEMPRLQREMRDQYDVEGFEFGSMGGYYTMEEVLTELDSMTMLYPDLITARYSIGLSLEEEDIWAIKISDNPGLDEEEPEILYSAVFHAREPQSMAATLYFMYYLLENYGSDPLATFLVDNREMYFVPVVNPDGYRYNEETDPDGGGMWRKNMQDNNGNGVFDPGYDGVDLNRNWGYMWGYDNTGSSGNPPSLTYRGTEPFSEPENQVLRDFCIAHNFRLAFTTHSASQNFYVPWAYLYDTHTPDSAIYMDLAANMTQFNGFPYYATPTPGGVANGDCMDWMYGEQTVKNKIIAFELETGNGTFWPSQSQIYPLCEELVYCHLALALGPGVLDTDEMLHVATASITEGFLDAGMDNLSASAVIVNPLADIVEVMAILQSTDQTFLDTLILYDDGTHDDGAAGDGQFAGSSPAPIAEKFFTSHIQVNAETSTGAFMNDIGSFTTAGPITFYGLDFVGDSIFYPGDTPKFYLDVINQSDTATIPDVAVTVSLVDEEHANVVGNGTWSFGDMEAGEIATSALYYWLNIHDDHPGDTTLTIHMEISSADVAYWEDVFNIQVELAPRIIHVPDDFASIQAAIDYAFDRDTVLIQPGTYPESISISKNIIVGSLTLIAADTSYISQTILDCDGIHHQPGILIGGSEDYPTVVDGLTVINAGGYASTGGGIAVADSTSPLIRNMIIRENGAPLGGGIYCGAGSAPVITNTVAYNNWSYRRNEDGDCGGIYCDKGSEVIIQYSVISRNRNRCSNGMGDWWSCEIGGLYCDSATVLLENVTVADNDEGGIYARNASDLTILNSILWGNTGSQIHATDTNTVISIAWSDLGEGQELVLLDSGSTLNWLEGNIDADPLFCDTSNVNYQLAENSPCVATGLDGVNMGAFGIGCVSPVAVDQTILPQEWALEQNFPNPFNPSTTLRYALPQPGAVDLTVYDIQGRGVVTLVNTVQTAGFYELQWKGMASRGEPVAAGMYFYRLEVRGPGGQTPSYSAVRKMLYLK